MKTKKNQQLAIILSLVFFVMAHVHSQEEKNSPIGLTVFFPMGAALGNNVYSQSHDQFWSGLGIAGHVDINNKIHIGLELSSIKSNISDKNIINAEETKFTKTIFQLGYTKNFGKSMILIPFVTAGFTEGTNQGDFNGYSYGLGLKGFKYFSKNFYIYSSGDWQRHTLDIQSSPFWSPRFNEFSLARLCLGVGFSLF